MLMFANLHETDLTTEAGGNYVDLKVSGHKENHNVDLVMARDRKSEKLGFYYTSSGDH